MATETECGYIDLLQPQHAIPDVFLWMISNNKRIAYHRIPARFVCTYNVEIYHLVKHLRSFPSLGHLVTWSLGHLVTWSLGHSVT